MHQQSGMVRFQGDLRTCNVGSPPNLPSNHSGIGPKPFLGQRRAFFMSKHAEIAEGLQGLDQEVRKGRDHVE